jgi:hypothetical protein
MLIRLPGKLHRRLGTIVPTSQTTLRSEPWERVVGIASASVHPELEVLESRWTPSVSFDSRLVIPAGTSPQSIAVGDFNSDRKLDLVFADQGAKFFVPASVQVLLNTTPTGVSTPSFGAAQSFSVGSGQGIGPHPDTVAVGDFNGDGKPDLAVANMNEGTVSILLNTTPTGSSAVSFTAQQTFVVGSGPGQLVVADFNGDGKPDVAVVNENDNTVSVLLNTTPIGVSIPSFAAQQTFAVGSGPRSLVAADINSDGKPDLAVTNINDKTVSVLLNTTPMGGGTATFAPQQTFAVGTEPISVAAADLNGGGKPDLAVVNIVDNSVSVLMNLTTNGATTATFAAQRTFAAGASPAWVTVADFNGDGKPDLAIADSGSGSVSVLVNTTQAMTLTPSFAPLLTFSLGNDAVNTLVAGDFNGDGRPDLAGTSAKFLASSTIPVLLNTSFSAVIGQFGVDGVWEYNSATGAWNQLTPANASLLVSDPFGDVAAEFPGHGVWEFTNAAGWNLINGIDATALAMSPNGLIAANFPHYGVGEYQPGIGWTSLTPSTATLLAMDVHGNVAGEFPGYGVQEYQPGTTWKQLNGVDATALAMDANGDIAANFPGFGVGEYTTSNNSWAVINGVQAQALAMNAEGDIAAQFAGYGVGLYVPGTGWSTLTASNASLLAADDGNIAGAFPGHGVWEFDPTRGWFQLTAAEAMALAMA